MSKPIREYWPSFYEDIKDFVELAQTEDEELQLAAGAVDQLFSDQFVMTAGIDAIKRREKMLGIQADPSVETLDFRRRRIVNRYSTKPPFTLRYLQQRLDQLVGPGLTVVSVDVQQFILYVTANIQNANVFREVQYTIETVKPANLAYQQNTSISEAVGLEEHIAMKAITWNYKLNGSWQLGEKPFASYGSEVIVK
ncbi:putative phage tail protein [Cohnella cellulosilytica]|uniref:Phage tail protein n=1 Tax=Cohnella cellulosilytica TaxID=986710 RepID=A0ABW2FNF0_9BACL